MEFNLRDLPTNKVLEQYSAKMPEVDVLSVEVCLNFLNTAREMLEAFQFHFSKHGISEGKFTILMLLLRQQDHRLLPSELAEKAGVTRGTITGLLDGLEKGGWIERESHKDDRRKITIHLQEEGKSRLIEMLPDHYLKTSKLMNNLEPKEKKELLRLVMKVQKGISVLYQD